MAIHLALVGCGNMAHFHAQQLKNIPDCRVVAVVDPVPAHTQAFKEKYFSHAIAYGSYGALLQQPPAGLEGVVLVTPHNAHYPQAREALERGLHVLCEKPLVTDSNHAFDLWEGAKYSNRTLSIAFQAPHSAAFRFLAHARDTGRLGNVQLVTGWIAQPWLTMTAGTWRQDPSIAGGGQMYDSGAHLINGILWLVNEPVVEVSCVYNTLNTDVDVNGVAILRFQSGALASIGIGGNCPAWGAELHVQTDAMRLITDTVGGSLRIVDREGKPVAVDLPKDDRPAAWTAHRNFIDVLQKKDRVRCGPRDALVLSALMEALYESAQDGVTVKVRAVPTDI
jgi:predicted dehydrogenase